MTYQQTLDFLFDQLPMYQRVGQADFKKDLTNIIALCDALGNPHQKFRSIHIAGTNGKGTTTHIIAAALQAHGMKVGVYTSPHYIDFKERIKINGTYISEEAVVGFVENNRALIDSVKPSFFEITVAMAFDYFAHQKVDIAVVEVGLGGRLDSTNIITPILSVITNISYDHQAILGDTLPQIAREKAGIIKPHIPVVIGEYQREVAKVFRDKALIVEAPITFISREISLENIEDKKHLIIKGKTWLKGIRSDVQGAYQEKNLLTALGALFHLHKILNLDKRKIKAGINKVRAFTGFMGRWQARSEAPLTIVDSAHNEAGIKWAVKQLKAYKKPVHAVIGFVNDKEVSKVLQLFPKNWKYYFCKADIPRGLDAELLKLQASQAGLTGETFSCVRSALASAQESAGKNEMVFVGGSIFVVGEVL